VLTDAIVDRVRKEIQAMGAEQKEHALARVKALGEFVRVSSPTISEHDFPADE
jgi:hypothetical protein